MRSTAGSSNSQPVRFALERARSTIFRKTAALGAETPVNPAKPEDPPKPDGVGSALKATQKGIGAAKTISDFSGKALPGLGAGLAIGQLGVGTAVNAWKNRGKIKADVNKNVEMLRKAQQPKPVSNW